MVHYPLVGFIKLIVMAEKYCLVWWPDIQDFMDHPRYKECYLCTRIVEVNNPEAVSVYAVPESLYNEVYQLD